MIAVASFPTFLRFPRGGAQQELRQIERGRKRQPERAMLMPQIAPGGVHGGINAGAVGVAQRTLTQTILTLQPDGTAGKDTFIFGGGDSNRNYGAATDFYIGERTDDTNGYRTLIRFDLSSIPAGAIIVSATLSLYANLDRSDNARTFRVFRLKRAWVEGTGNFSVSGDGATWNVYSPGNNWQTAGGFGTDDCEQTDIGSLAFTATATLNQFYDWSLTPSAIQEMITGGSFTNNGFLLKADTENNDAYRFSSSDNATAGNRPKLVITYLS